MRLTKAFLWVSLFSYIATMILIINNVQILGDFVAQQNSALMTSLIFIGMMMFSLYDNKLNLVWCGVFGAWALVSFLGLIQWHNHLGAMDLNVPMAIWDLIIGVSMYLESELYVS